MLLVSTAFAALLLAGTGVAIADGINPFAGIGAANHSQSAQDVLDPASLTLVERFNSTAARQASHTGVAAMTVLPDTARLVGQLPSGRQFYVLGTTTSQLCILTAPPPRNSSDKTASIGCGDPLDQNKPTTIESQDEVVNGPDATPPLTFGVARDDVAAVSFVAGGTEQTVPVKNNVWAFEGQNSALESLTVHYSDGSEQTLSP